MLKMLIQQAISSSKFVFNLLEGLLIELSGRILQTEKSLDDKEGRDLGMSFGELFFFFLKMLLHFLNSFGQRFIFYASLQYFIGPMAQICTELYLFFV